MGARYLRTRKTTSIQPRTPTTKRRRSSRACELAARTVFDMRSQLSKSTAFQLCQGGASALYNYAAKVTRRHTSAVEARFLTAWFQLRIISDSIDQGRIQKQK